MKRRLRTAVLLGTLLLSLLPLSSQERAEPYALPTDALETYSAAISVFQGIGLPGEHSYLTSSVPRLILEKLQEIPSHRLTEAEITGYRNRLLEDARIKAGQELASLLTRRDELLFGDLSPDAWAESFRKATEQVEEKRKQLEFFLRAEPRSIAVAEEKPLSIASGDDQLLIGVPEASGDAAIQALAEGRRLQMLVLGTVEEIQGYLYFQIDVWSTLSKSRIAVFQDAVTPDGVADLVASLSDELAGTVLGRPWGTLRVAVEPAEAFVYVDESLEGTGDTVVRYLSPGQHSVRVERDGYFPLERTVDVNVGAESTVTAELAAVPKETTSVLTEPPGADVYVGAVWQGKTPVSIETPSRITRILLRLDGYRDVQHIIRPTDSRTLSLTLVPESVELPEFTRKKNDFYTSFGLFALSLPFTVGFYGMAQNFNYAAGDAFDAEDSTLLQRSWRLFTYAYYGGLAVSGTLFVNMMFRLFDYIRTGEATF